MNLDTALRINAAAMSAARTRVNVASSNLANAETTRTEEGGPFRRRMVIQKAEVLKDEAGYPIGRHEGMSIREPIAAGMAFDNSPPRLVFDPSHPDANEDGYVSMPNVQVVEEMVDMISASTAYRAAANAVMTVKTMAQRALDLAT
jgi:flagellar basal-body rod protein FlgC